MIASLRSCEMPTLDTVTSSHLGTSTRCTQCHVTCVLVLNIYGIPEEEMLSHVGWGGRVTHITVEVKHSQIHTVHVKRNQRPQQHRDVHSDALIEPDSVTESHRCSTLGEREGFHGLTFYHSFLFLSLILNTRSATVGNTLI